MRTIETLLLTTAMVLTLGAAACAASLSTPFMVANGISAQLVCTITNVSSRVQHVSAFTVFDATGNPHDLGPFDLRPSESKESGIGLREAYCTWTISGSKNDVRTGINVFDGVDFIAHGNGS
jgi:hypothetical protein